MTGLLERRLLFVTGKGGVGKTTVAAGLGLLAARSGLRTLVCEVDSKGNLADFYEAGPTSFKARQIGWGMKRSLNPRSPMMMSRASGSLSRMADPPISAPSRGGV